MKILICANSRLLGNSEHFLANRPKVTESELRKLGSNKIYQC